MKKIIALLLALIMVMGLATVVSAEGETTAPTTYADMSTVTIDKTYTITNVGTSYPDETFNFAFGEEYTVKEGTGGVGSDNQPMPTIGTVTFETADGTATKQVTVTLPTYTAVGVYNYTITETAGNTAGVDYYDGTIKLVVTVIQDGDNKVRVAAVHTEATGDEKSNDIENVYNAGSLSVTKTVEGNMGDRGEYFPIQITLTGDENKDYTGNVITVGATSYAENPTAVVVGTPVTFYLKHGETIALGNIPYDVTYAVEETDTKGHTVAYDGNEEGTINSASASTTVTNTKTAEVDTGVFMDSVPFVVMAVVAVLGVVAITAKKRVQE